MNAYFFADAHIGAMKTEVTLKRCRNVRLFLESIKADCTHLFIVGDLFDFWFEYKTVIPAAPFQVLHTLKTMSDSGVEITLIAGNHDFAVGQFFEKELNISVYAHALERELDNRRFYIAHGDGLNPNDKAYRFIKKIIRHPFSNTMFKLLHPDLGIQLAHTLSHLSRNHRAVKDRDQIYIDFAKQKFEEGSDYVILGHTHRPQEFEENAKVYINTGDWIDSMTYGHYDGNTLKLKQFQV